MFEKKSLSFEEIRERLSSLQQDETLELMVLFGSSAKGKTHARSDIDLAFSFRDKIDLIDLTNKVAISLGTDAVDVVDMRKASPLLRFAVAKTGRVLYEKTPGLFHSFCSLAFRVYVDTGKLREARAQSIENFIRQRSTA
jgi:uncharacterized protein